jgi:hypothetical protein
MRLTKQILREMIEEAMHEGNEAQEIYKILKGWWSAAKIDESIRKSYTKDSHYRKSGYKGDPLGSDAFFEKHYVGKSFQLKFLDWTGENRWRKSKYGNVRDAIAITVGNLIMRRMPKLKELSDWGEAYGTKETSKLYPNIPKDFPTYRFKPDILLLAKAIMDKDLEAQQTFVGLIQEGIDSIRSLQQAPEEEIEEARGEKTPEEVKHYAEKFKDEPGIEEPYAVAWKTARQPGSKGGEKVMGRKK